MDFTKLKAFTKIPAVPSFALPTALASIGARLPQWPHAIPITLALNAMIRAGSLGSEQIAELEGKHFRIRVLDAGTVADFSVQKGRFVPSLLPVVTPDLCFSASLSAYLQLIARQEDPDTLFFARRLSIEGDTELGLQVKNMFDAIDFDGMQERLRQRVQQRLAFGPFRAAGSGQ